MEFYLECFNGNDTIRIIRGTTRQDITMEEISLEVDKTPHGGGDYLMFDKLFGGMTDDPLEQVAGFEAGANSAFIGICANEAIKQNTPVKIPGL